MALVALHKQTDTPNEQSRAVDWGRVPVGGRVVDERGVSHLALQLGLQLGLQSG